MRSRTAILSIVAASALLLAGCAAESPSSSKPADKGTEIVASSVTEPAAVGERVGAEDRTLEVWSGIIPNETLGEAEAGHQWVTANVGQWVSEEVGAADVAPVLRSTADETFSAEGVANQYMDFELAPGKSYTFVWNYQVPDELVDPATLVLCVGEGDEGCSLLAE